LCSGTLRRGTYLNAGSVDLFDLPQPTGFDL